MALAGRPNILRHSESGAQLFDLVWVLITYLNLL